MELPIVDFSPFVDQSVGATDSDGKPTLAQQKVAEAIDQACRVHGFVCLRNTGIPKSLVEKTFGASQTLFQMSDDDKAKLKPLNPTSNTGYVGFGSEALNPRRSPDLKEAFNVRNPDQKDTNDNFLGTPFAFQDTAVDFWNQAMQLSDRFSRCCAIALGLDLDYFAKTIIQRDLCTLRMLHYPPCPTNDGQSNGSLNSEVAIRVGEHTDFGAYTFLFVHNFQDESSHGLQVKSIEGGDLASGSMVARDEEMFTTGWKDVVFAPSVLEAMKNDTSAALLVNTGALMARWTNDVWRATAHRVVVKPEARDSHRYSMAIFFDPDKSVICSVDPKFVPPGEVAKYPPISSLDYLMMKLREVQGVK